MHVPKILDIKLLNYINNEGAAFKQYNAKTIFLDLKKSHWIESGKIFTVINRRGGVEVERSPRMLDIGVRLPFATDLSRKNT